MSESEEQRFIGTILSGAHEPSSIATRFDTSDDDRDDFRPMSAPPGVADTVAYQAFMSAHTGASSLALPPLSANGSRGSNNNSTGLNVHGNGSGSGGSLHSSVYSGSSSPRSASPAPVSNGAGNIAASGSGPGSGNVSLGSSSDAVPHFAGARGPTQAAHLNASHRRSGSDTELAAHPATTHSGVSHGSHNSHITEQMRMDPAYYTFYYSQRPLDPRLPPPIVAPASGIHHMFLAERQHAGRRGGQVQHVTEPLLREVRLVDVNNGTLSDQHESDQLSSHLSRLEIHDETLVPSGNAPGGPQYPQQRDMMYMLQQQAQMQMMHSRPGDMPMLDQNTLQMLLLMQQQQLQQAQAQHQNQPAPQYGLDRRAPAAGPELWDYPLQAPQFGENGYFRGVDRDPFDSQDQVGRPWTQRGNGRSGKQFRHGDDRFGGNARNHDGQYFGSDRGGMERNNRRVPSHQSHDPDLASPHAPRSALLEEFRAWHINQHMGGQYSGSGKRFDLQDIYGHVVEFAEDQHGSRFIQQKLETATPEEKDRVFDEIAPETLDLVVDVFGNYVVQKFFEYGTKEQKAILAKNLKGSVVSLSLQMYGCRVVQKALESLDPDQCHELVLELDGSIMKCVKDQNGNHVIQKVIERVKNPSEAIDFVVKSFLGSVYALATHPYGCRVIQRILENCTAKQQEPVLDELMRCTIALVQDQYGNYVIQHVFQHKLAGSDKYKKEVLKRIRGQIVSLSQHKFASNVIEKCVEFGSPEDRQVLLREVLEGSDGDAHNLQTSLWSMMKDQYANYVIQKMIDTLDEEHRQLLITHIRPHMAALRKFTYGKHILARVDRYLALSMPGGTSDGIHNRPQRGKQGRAPRGRAPDRNGQHRHDQRHASDVIPNGEGRLMYSADGSAGWNRANGRHEEADGFAAAPSLGVERSPIFNSF